MADKKLSFKAGTEARAARGSVAEDIKSGKIESKARSPFALATYITKRMGPSARRRVAARR
jgi:hypothetical protein